MKRQLHPTRTRPEMWKHRCLSSQLVQTYHASSHALLSLSFAPTYSRFICAGEEGTIIQCEDGYGSVWASNVHENCVFHVEWDSWGVGWYTCSADQATRKWDGIASECIATFRGHQGSVKHMAQSPTDTHCILTCGRDGRVLLFDDRVQTKTDHSGVFTPPCGTFLYPESKRTSVSVTSVRYLNTGNHFLSACDQNTSLLVWDVRKHHSPSSRISLSPSSHGIASLDRHPLHETQFLAHCTRGTTHLFDFSLPRPVLRTFSVKSSGSFYNQSVFSPCGEYVAISSSQQQSIYIFHTRQSTTSHPTKRLSVMNPNGICWSMHDSEMIGCCTDDGKILRWKLST